MTFFIGLAGPGCVGKSTTMRAIHELLPSIAMQLPHGLQLSMCGMLLEQRSFAQPLYEMIAVMTGLTIEQLKATKEIDWTAETAPVPSLIGWSPRKLLKHYGEFTRATVSQEFWVQRATVESRAIFVVFDDARHDPEFQVCKAIIELERDGIVYAKDHPSSMPPDPEWIDLKVNLTGRTPEHVAREIIEFFIERLGMEAPKTNIAAN